MSEQSAVASFRRGVSGSSIRAGVILPPRDVLPTVAAEIAGVLSAYVDELNAAGGVLRRRLDLVFEAPEGSIAGRVAVVREFVERERILALVASFTEGADLELGALAKELQIPLLATLSASPCSSGAPNPWVRDLCGGVVEQSAALIKAVQPQGVVAIVDDDAQRAAAIVQRAEILGFRARSAESIDELHALEPAAAVLATADLRLLDAMRMNECPPLLVTGATMPPRLLDRMRPKHGAWVAMPAIDRDQSEEAVAAWRELTQRSELPANHPLSQFAALTSLQLFVDALRRTEGAIDRETLVEVLDETRAFHSGLLPPLTYTRRRHIGSTGAWIFAMHGEGGAEWADATPPARA